MARSRTTTVFPEATVGLVLLCVVSSVSQAQTTSDNKGNHNTIDAEDEPPIIRRCQSTCNNPNPDMPPTNMTGGDVFTFLVLPNDHEVADCYLQVQSDWAGWPPGTTQSMIGIEAFTAFREHGEFDAKVDALTVTSNGWTSNCSSRSAEPVRPLSEDHQGSGWGLQIKLTCPSRFDVTGLLGPAVDGEPPYACNNVVWMATCANPSNATRGGLHYNDTHTHPPGGHYDPHGSNDGSQSFFNDERLYWGLICVMILFVIGFALYYEVKHKFRLRRRFAFSRNGGGFIQDRMKFRDNRAEEEETDQLQFLSETLAIQASGLSSDSDFNTEDVLELEQAELNEII